MRRKRWNENSRCFTNHHDSDGFFEMIRYGVQVKFSPALLLHRYYYCHHSSEKFQIDSVFFHYFTQGALHTL